MPYAFALGGFAIFTALAISATLGCWLYAPLRWALPFAWRIWVWGSVGFILANGILLAILIPILTNVAFVGTREATPNLFTVLIGFGVVLGPMLASALGTFVGAAYGWYLAWRKVARTRAAA